MSGHIEIRDCFLVLAPMGLKYHESAPVLAVVRLLTSPREVRRGKVCVHDAGKNVGGHRAGTFCLGRDGIQKSVIRDYMLSCELFGILDLLL